MIGFNRRFDPSFAEVRVRVLAGEIGALEQLSIISRDPEPPPAGYLASCGGLFRDMTIHVFDIAGFGRAALALADAAVESLRTGATVRPA